MIKPTEVSITIPTHEVDIARQERLFDAAIKCAETAGVWPAVVTAARDGATIDVIRATIMRYRDAGWRVTEGAGSVRATIDHPERQPERDYAPIGGA